MPAIAAEFEELRVSLDRLRTLLESLIVRGLRACGRDEIHNLSLFIEELEKIGAPTAASALADLKGKIEAGTRDAAKSLLLAQTTVRMLERLLTLRVARALYDNVCATNDAIEGEDAEDDE